MKQPVDFIIIGSGIAGLYAAYQIKRISPPNTTILILEKNTKQWMGGRIGNDTFYGADVVVGAGVGRKNKDHALIQCDYERLGIYALLISSINSDIITYSIYPDTVINGRYSIIRCDSNYII